MTPAPTLAKTGFAQDLIDWYLANGRKLPWRDTHDPYAIWLSEIMLQQTQVKTVLDYYRRFLQKYPTITDLAQAPLGDVLKQWEGLGYYARCRNLHKTAQTVSQAYGGRFPDTMAAVTALPGIGQSTAGAILTFAYGQKHPLLDGNVKRVLSRVFDIDEDIAEAGTQKRLWACSEALLADASDPYAFNQGIMELGATVCMPKEPRCLVCPVQRHCDASARGTQGERPVKAKAKATPHYDIAVAIISHPGDPERVFVQQRPAEGLLGGLWEFPGGKREAGETLEATLLREIKEELGWRIDVGRPLPPVKHAYTHFKITLHAYRCTLKARQKPDRPAVTAAQAWQWIGLDAIDTLAFPKANLRVLAALRE